MFDFLKQIMKGKGKKETKVKKEKKVPSKKRELKTLTNNLMMAISSNDIPKIIDSAKALQIFSTENPTLTTQIFNGQEDLQKLYEGILSINDSYQIEHPFSFEHEYKKMRPYFKKMLFEDSALSNLQFLIIMHKLDQASSNWQIDCEKHLKGDKLLYEEIYLRFRNMLIDPLKSSQKMLLFAETLQKIDMIPDISTFIENKINGDKKLVDDIYQAFRSQLIHAVVYSNQTALEAAGQLLNLEIELVPNLMNKLETSIAKDKQLSRLMKAEITEDSPLLSSQNTRFNNSDENQVKVINYISDRVNKPEYYERLGFLKITFFGKVFGHCKTAKIQAAEAFLKYLQNPEDQKAFLILQAHKDELTSGNLGDIYKSCMKF